MFKGIDTSRPWPETGMTSAKWLTIPSRTVNLHNLVLTQDGIYFQPLLKSTVPVGGDTLPHVIFWDEKWYLEDGHHRVMKSAMYGMWMIKARVLFLDRF